MPCWRQSAAVAAPASCSFRTPTICSCVNRLPRILSSLGPIPVEDSQYLWTSFRGAGHKARLLDLSRDRSTIYRPADRRARVQKTISLRESLIRVYPSDKDPIRRNIEFVADL